MILGPGLLPLIHAIAFTVANCAYWFLGFVLASIHDDVWSWVLPVASALCFGSVLFDVWRTNRVDLKGGDK